MSNDFDIIRHILKYTKEIQQTINRFGDSEFIFSTDIDYKNSVCMGLLQIGELATKLSDEYKMKTKDIMNWSAMKALRNVFAHAYGSVRFHEIWGICKKDIPVLQSFCIEQLNQIDNLNQSDTKKKPPKNIMTL